MTDPVRLSKRVAALRTCSRREAEQVIAGGWVRVNGSVVESPQFRVADDDAVTIAADADPSRLQTVTLLFHKPAGMSMQQLDTELATLVSAASRWDEDPTDTRPLKAHFSQLAILAPLAPEAAGLVVLSQDWHIARKLNEDTATLEHELIVEVAGELIPNGLRLLNRGAGLSPAPSALKVSWQNETHLRIALKGARAGDVGRLCTAAGLRTIAERRIRLGGVSMGRLPPGCWRYLPDAARF